MKIPINWLEEYVEIPDNLKGLGQKLTMVGHMLDKELTINSEKVFDLELRGNRADCYSILGIAREVAAIYNTRFIPPESLDIHPGKIKTKLKVNSKYVKRVGMSEVKNVTIKKSPDWLSKKLEIYGMESINNIVDLTNYVMIETGEPMHAFDADKIGQNLEIRLAGNAEKMTTFQGSEVSLTNEDLVWAKGQTVLSVAGAIGEKYNSISEDTKNILVEAANYDRANIRKSVYRHSLFTEAGIRHEKELDPNLVSVALARFLYLIKENDWGEVSETYSDYYPHKIKPWKIKLYFKRLNALGGVDLSNKSTEEILKRLNFQIFTSTNEAVEVLVPTYRTDVISEEDLIEEVLRIYGYENIPHSLLAHQIPANITPDYIKQEEMLRNSATGIGFNEIISSSFVKNELLNLNSDPDNVAKKDAFLINPPSPDFKVMRKTLLPNLYQIANKIINERGEDVRLFEIGKVYYQEKERFYEKRKFGLIYKKNDTNFADFKGVIEAFVNKVSLPQMHYEISPKNLPLNNSFDLVLEKEVIGFAGLYNDIYYLELDLDSILNKSAKYEISLWPKYPPQIEDLTFVVAEKTYVGDVINTIKLLNHLINKVMLKDVYENAYTFRVWYQDPGKTLSNGEVQKIRNQIISTLKSRYNILFKE